MAGARRFNLDAFLLALEGWRRGLTLRWYHEVPPESNIKLIGFTPVGKIFSLSDGNKTHFFYRSRGDLVSNKAVDIAGDKFETKKLLLQSGVNTPVGQNFNSSHSIGDIINYALSLNRPITIKPTLGSLGNGVFTNVTTEADIKYAVNYIRNELDYIDVLVEEYITGDDIRVYIVGGEVVAATKREPASIIGDGEHSIEYLIECRNKERKKNPQLSTRLVKITDELKNYLNNQGLTLQAVPEQGSKIFLSGKANVSSGGDSINISQVPEHVKEQAIKALEALPDIQQGGVDLIYDDQQASVLEINATAGIVLHILPAIGEPIRVEEKIIDYYFPETKGFNLDNKVYFNYKKVNELLTNQLVSDLQITKPPKYSLITRKFIVKGKVQGVSYRRYVQKHAIELGINGYVKNLKNGNVVIVLGAVDEMRIKEFKEVCKAGSRRSVVQQLIEKEWDKQINIGFEVRK
nr:acylphosphatase [Allobacillus halotolerans]